MQGLHMKRAGGFTLIELLVVISIIAMLSSLVLGAISNVRRKAFYAKAAIDVRTLETALELYYQDHGDWPMPNAGIARSSEPLTWDQNSPLGIALRPYLAQLPVPAYPSVQGNQEYLYMTQQTQFYRVSSSVGPPFSACIWPHEGYWLDFYWSGEQIGLTLNDQGVDNDGIEKMRGDIEISYNSNDCLP